MTRNAITTMRRPRRHAEARAQPVPHLLPQALRVAYRVPAGTPEPLPRALYSCSDMTYVRDVSAKSPLDLAPVTPCLGRAGPAADGLPQFHRTR